MLEFVVDVLRARISVVATVRVETTLGQRHVPRLRLDFATTARRFDLRGSCAPAKNTTIPDGEPSSPLPRLFVVGVHTRDQVTVLYSVPVDSFELNHGARI